MSSPRIEDLVNRYRDAQRRGESLSLDDLCRDCPELLPLVRQSLTETLPPPSRADATIDAPSKSQKTIPPSETIPAPPDQNATVGYSIGGGVRTGRKPAAQVPGYEIVGELGHGGMGVVYLAEHVRLKRQVALKMMKAGADAEPEQIARFRAEAEAVAHLHHPHIVQIYEVGEHDGCPFIALEYLEGDSLKSKLGNKPMPAKDAAQIIETLARALHHAHQRGVVHRDIKPGNVLLMDDGTPKITDFGLAKRLEDSQIHHTRTGVVMGTPSYMSPEQAAGKTAEIGPLSDVYSLGAMLFELLTAQTPFQSDTVMTTLNRVINEEPTPPSRLVRCDRDVETICLKAMAKSPARRYSSALALAQDLERYRAGEPILARRQGPIGKAIVKLRRNAVAVVATILVVAGLALAGWFFLGARTASQAANLTRQFEEALDVDPWTAEHREQLQALLTQMKPLDPNLEATSQQRLNDRFARLIREHLKRPRLDEAQVAELKADLAWLAPRDRTMADTLAAELASRLREWRPLFELKAPFANRAEVFETSEPHIDGDALVVFKEQLQPQATRISSAEPVQIEATFAPSWDKAYHLGLSLNQTPGKLPSPVSAPGYTFLLDSLTPEEPSDGEKSDKPKSPPKRLPFEMVDRRATMSILRNGVVLRQQKVALPAGVLRLAARREGERLEFQVTGCEPLAVFDIIALGGDRPGVVGVHVPNRTRLLSLRAEHMSLPASPSPLERADGLLAAGQSAEALLLFQEQARVAASPALAAEAWCKAGLCLVQLKRVEEAIKPFETAMAAPGDRWPLIAATQLCVIHLQRKNLDEVDAIFTNAKTRFDPKLLPLYVTDEARGAIFSQGHLRVSNYMFLDRSVEPRLELLIRLSDLFQDKRSGFYLRWELAKAYGLAGQEQAALRVIQDVFPQAVEGVVDDINGSITFTYVMRLYAWMMARQGKAGQTTGILENLGRDLPRRIKAANPFVTDDRMVLVTLPIDLESARLHAFVGHWEIAEAVLDKLLSKIPDAFDDYNLYASAHLMKGFCRERAGDAAGAQTAWKKGNYPAFLKTFSEEARRARLYPHSRHGMFDYLMLASLTGELSDADADGLMQNLIASVSGSDNLFQQAIALVNVSPAIMRNMYKSPRGHEFARRLAFLDVSPADYYHLPPLILLYEKFRQDLFAGKPSPEQDDIAWTGVEQASNLFFQNKMTRTQAFQAGLTWKGTVNFLGWGSLGPTLPTEVRGPISYLFGQRYLKLNRPQDAIVFFRTASADAPAASPLKRLAEEEIGRLNKK